MELLVSARGIVRCVYDEGLDLLALGTVRMRRASIVEPDEQGGWWAELSLVDGPKLGPFRRRSQALAAEQRWLAEHWLHRCESSHLQKETGCGP
jgi:hypothetical protein